MATATAPEIQRYRSLIPYLQGKSGEPRLKLDLFPWGARQSELAYPFALVDDSDPLWRLLEARFVTDARHTLKKVLLRTQKDRYFLPSGDPKLNNAQIDAASRAFALEGEAGGAVLQIQRDPQGEPVPLAPLFFCRETRRFFPPLCPGCGLPLTLCTDDTLLERFGLAPYWTSLKRYLHCGSCARHGVQEFYQYENEPNDPISVKDRWSLMERFRQIDSSMDPDDQLPCVSCAGRDACFGTEPEARRRIVPFSFYPFHLLIVDPPTLHAVVSQPPAADDFQAVRAALEKLKEEARRELRGLAPQVPVPLEGESAASLLHREPSAPSDDGTAATLAAAPSNGAAAAPAARIPAYDDDETMETVILSPGPIRPRGAPLLPRADLCETFVPGPSPAPPAVTESAADQLMETMVAPDSRLRPSAPAPCGAERIEAPKPAPAPAPASAPASAPAQASASASAAEMTETIFVPPPGGRRPSE